MDAARRKRKLRRDSDRAVAVAVAPLVVSQLNVTAAFGLSERRYRELVAKRQLPHTREGKLVLVAADVLRAALVGENDAPEQPEEPTSNLARLRAVAGLHVAGAR